MDLDALADSLAPTTVADPSAAAPPPAAPSPAKPARAPRALATTPPMESSPGVGSVSPPEPATPPSFTAPPAPPSPMTATQAFDALLADGNVTACLDRFVIERFPAEHEAVVAAERVARAATIDAALARTDVGNAEHDLLRDRSDEAHAALQTARARHARAIDLVTVTERDRVAKVAALASLRVLAARDLAQEAVRQARHDYVLVTPTAVAALERMAALCQSFACEVAVFEAAVQRQQRAASLVPELTQLGGMRAGPLQSWALSLEAMQGMVAFHLFTVCQAAGVRTNLAPWLPTDGMHVSHAYTYR